MAREFSTVGVVGLGTMGAGIAEVFARNGIAVVGVERDQEALDRGRGHVEHSTGRAVRRGKLTEADQARLLDAITFTTDLDALGTCELVVEAVPEHLELKRRNAELNGDLPLDRYKSDDPFDNHPLFKSEEQARIEETMDGEESLPPEPPAVVAEPEPANDDSLWGRSRDFDWGD